MILPSLLYYEMTKNIPLVYQNGIISSSLPDIASLPEISLNKYE